MNVANFAAFEIDDEVLSNLREYALSNALFWALAEGHACEQSARRNAMDVGGDSLLKLEDANGDSERLQERRRYDHEVPDSLQPNTSSRDYRRIGRNYHRCGGFGRVRRLCICSLVNSFLALLA